ncbi:MAG: hypothetical protein PF638_13190 [Candidatus Delongbacteria bacterium]|jgi:RNA-splicing ligase RtcB|nr:hypothetical protein [Candidatus Delongbacteria bacterium]
MQLPMYTKASEGGVHSAMIPNIIHKLYYMPIGAIGYKFPIAVLKKLYI